MFQISVLGPVEVRRDGQLVPVPGGKTSELLVRLALEAGVLVRTDRLVDDLWAADAVNTRRNTLQSKVARLRRALGDPPVIVSGDGGYTLAVDPSDVDALAVLRDAVAASRLLDAGDDRGAAELCASTLQLYRGEVLQAAGDGEWVTPHRARLEEARMKLVETQFSARLRLGDVGDVIGELEAAVATYPFQEGLWELLITALYRAGRQADALATYQRVRNQLADELGLDPGPQLQQLEQQILVHDPSLGVPDRTARALEPDAPAGNLPSMSAELVGREAEIAALSDLLASERLVEIVGPGGIGKTAVAIATGRTLTASDDVAPGGVWLARLETATTADEVVDTLIAALNVTGGEAALFERLKGTAALVILDNCEHVVDAAAALAVRLLDAAPGLRILCTSQVPLDVDGEAVFELAPLALSDAVELFTRRASAQRTNQHVGEADDAVRDLCRSLDGLPLAIELAAARTKTLSIEEITRRLDDRFNVLSDPTSRRPERRRALKATIRWSYELLFPDDQRGLWALATFAGGAPLPAVESVLEALDVPAAAAIDVVGRLASRSLVIVDDDDASMPVRYRLLDSIRAFALEAMTEAGLTERALAAHAAWFADAAGSSTARRAQQPPGRASRLRPGRARQHRRRPGLERRARPAARARHRQRVRLGLGRPRRQPRRATDPGRARRRRRRGPDPRPGRRPAARGVDRSVDRSTSSSPATTSPRPPSWPTRSTTSTCRRAAATTSPTSCRITASSAQAMELTDRSARSTTGWTGRGIRPRTGSSPPEPRSPPATRSAASRRVDQVEHWLRHGRRPVAARSPRRDARRAGPHPAPVRRRRPPHRSRRGDVATSRLSADRGVPALQSRTSAVPGRRLRRRCRHPGARDRQGRSHR